MFRTEKKELNKREKILKSSGFIKKGTEYIRTSIIAKSGGFKKVKEITVKCAKLDKAMKLMEQDPAMFTLEQKEEIFKGYEKLLDQLEQDGYGRTSLIKIDGLRREINEKRKFYKEKPTIKGGLEKNE